MAPALIETARRWRAAARPAVVVTVWRTRGSVPREAGTRMLVAADAVLGTLGGGHLELQAIAHARALLLTGRGDEQRMPLGPALGQCCGGVVTLRYTPLRESDPAAWTLPAPRFTLLRSSARPSASMTSSGTASTA